MLIEVSIGEVLDKISILSIKLNKIEDMDKLRNISKELSYLTTGIDKDLLEDDLYTELCGVNMRLWEIEDDIRECERKGQFNNEFIRLARAVYHRNDERAEIKKKINLKYGSQFVEEKSYTKY